MTIGQCPIPGGEHWPGDMHGVRLSTFATQDQHLLYNLCASRYNDSLQWVGATELSEKIFQMFVLKFKHTQGFQYLLFHDPTSRDTQMPQIGEACKVSFVYTNTDDVSLDSVNDLTTQLILTEALGLAAYSKRDEKICQPQTAWSASKATSQDDSDSGEDNGEDTDDTEEERNNGAESLVTMPFDMNSTSVPRFVANKNRIEALFVIGDVETVPEVMAVTGKKTPLQKSYELESESEACKVSFVDANADDVPAQNINDPPGLIIGEERAACHAIHQAMIEAQGDENPVALTFAAEPYLQRPLTEDELAALMNLLHDDSIEDEKYDQITDQLLGIEALLRLPTGHVPRDNSGIEVWFSAVRIGLQIPHIHSRYYVFAVRVPVDNDVTGNNDELPIPVDISVEDITPRDQEETQAFFDRLTQCDNAQSIRMKMDVSMKLKRTYQHIVDFALVTQFVNLAAELPGVQSILAGTGPQFLMDIYENMNNEMRQAVLETPSLRNVMV
ncbi:unnamed protein product [Fusarium equiseti]|uniref:Uncharacterized protein n=1 Tax=Fusarium equiseti TaxID=61235 RepID=A0A8J2IHD3_FUSEQ|nr:unnamed protein product [Fusarium equiseti]